jgi:NAD(P)-dependent dehydrogenase (short-subunit alcohol dehydrogenase family)
MQGDLMSPTPINVIPYRRALIIGAGAGLSASIARQLRAEGLEVTLAARDTNKLAALCQATGAQAHACEASDPDAVASLFDTLDRDDRTPDVLIYNPSARSRGSIVDLVPAEVERALAVGAFGAFLAAQQAVRRMLPAGRGAILFTGASASLKGFAQSAPFAMAKFALRGLAQSLARELQPQGIHVAHVVIDGGIRSERRPQDADRPDSLLDPEAIAQSYLALLRQPRNAWSAELDLRPWVERF